MTVEEETKRFLKTKDHSNKKLGLKPEERGNFSVYFDN